VHVATLQIELHIPNSHSLKEKRAVIKPILESARRRFQVAAAAVDHQGKWQRASLGFAVVGGSPAHVSVVLDKVERFVWSFPEIDVIARTTEHA